jgi:excisionase family DNA binding protein
MVTAKVREEPLPMTLTVAQVAALISVSRRQAYKLVNDGVIPSVRLGGSIRVPTVRFLEVLDLHSRESVSPAARAQGSRGMERDANFA